MIRSRLRVALRRRFDERGATIVEFAIVAPVLFLLVVGLLDFSLIIAGNTVGANAAREGARIGALHYDNADAPSSPNRTLIVDEINKRLGGLVRDDTIVVTIRCVTGSNAALTTTACTSGGAAAIVAGRDLIEISFTWQHIGASPFVANSLHNEKAMLVIQGRANYAPPAPTTTSTTTTTAPPVCRVITVTPQRSPLTFKVLKGSIKNSPGPANIRATTANCSAGQVILTIPGAPRPYRTGVAMTLTAANTFDYLIDDGIPGDGWVPGSYTATVSTPTGPAWTAPVTVS